MPLLGREGEVPFCGMELEVVLLLVPGREGEVPFCGMELGVNEVVLLLVPGREGEVPFCEVELGVKEVVLLLVPGREGEVPFARELRKALVSDTASVSTRRTSSGKTCKLITGTFSAIVAPYHSNSLSSR